MGIINHAEQERTRAVEPTFFAAPELAKAAAGYIERQPQAKHEG